MADDARDLAGDWADELLPEFWGDAVGLVRAAPIGFLATAAGAQPHVRAVTPVYVGLRIYIAAARGGAMTRQIAGNPRVELLHWTPDFRHLHIVGEAELREGSEADAIGESFPYPLDDFFAEDRSDMTLIAIEARRIAFTTLADIAADKPPRIWRAAD